ncbi:14-3-3-like protein isoform X2 [Lineus longissimus]|uniref:14-3-3-like protein isoform X2 n=1 Tax=Lineus longissimus TaxID=88925 RepID=UPI00315DF2D9
MSDDNVLFVMAKLAEQAERYDDMAKTMTELTESTTRLSSEQRNLLSVAFKNVVGAKRSAWRIISSIEQKALEKNDEGQQGLAAKYREEIEAELRERCDKVIQLIGEKLLPSLSVDAGEDADGKVFYTKMKGDYLRYITEVALGDERKEVALKAKLAYEEAAEAAKELPSTHPIKLGLCLNHSVFCYEIENNAKQACDLAKKAFDDAISELDSLKEDSYKDSTLIMQLLRDNLTLWVSEKDDEEDNVDDQ